MVVLTLIGTGFGLAEIHAAVGATGTEAQEELVGPTQPPFEQEKTAEPV